jgi:hypothetical protein
MTLAECMYWHISMLPCWKEGQKTYLHPSEELVEEELDMRVGQGLSRAHNLV